MLGFVSLTALAQDPNEPTDLDEQARYLGFRPSYYTCIDHNDGSMPSLQACADAEFVYQDKRLNRVYGKLVKSLSASDRIALRDEERAWIKKKDGACVLAEHPGQGQMLDAASCAVTETARRARELEHRLTK
jgi:uncharacterized protein YecT (DUF1311 family)